MASKKAKSSGSHRPAGPLVKLEEDKEWYDHAYQEKAADESDMLAGAALKELESQATVFLSRDVDLYNKMLRSGKESEAQWLSTVVQKGTQADRTTAMLLQINRSPVHSLFYINSLVNIIDRKNLRQAVDIIKAVHELFGKHLLPPNRKLVPFAKRPLARLNDLCSGNEIAKEKRLIVWKFESDLKQSYETLVRGLESLAGGNVEAISVQSCRTMLDLLAERPEQEQFLLSSLVNRLGHPNSKVAAKVSLYLIELTRRQPNMRLTVVKETERLIYRKNISEKAQMYAVSFMSQIVIGGPEAPTLAVTMLNIYFGLFKILVANKKMDDRISNTLVVATSRAFPYAKEMAKDLLAEIDSLYKLVHVTKYSTSLQALKLIMQVLSASEGVSDRFYAALYGKLLEPHTSSLETQLFTLVYKAIERDPVEERVRAFVKRLLQMALVNRPSYACATLIIVSKIQQAKNILKFTKNADTTLYVRDGEVRTDDASDEEEHFVDAPEPSDDEEEKTQNGKKGKKNKKKKDAKKGTEKEEEEPTKAAGWMHRQEKKDSKHGVSNVYNPSARNPLFCNANQSVDTELVLLAQHYHPSVRVFATNLLEGNAVVYKGDPFHDFSMLRFLERFVFKNPKSKKDDEKNQKKEYRMGIKYKKYEPEGVRGLAVNSEEFVNKKRQQIPADELYLHRFATLKLKKDEKTEEDEWSDAESINSDEFEVMLHKFEPGEDNEEFEVDFGKEFSAENTGRKKGLKRSKGDDDDDDSADDDFEDDVEDAEFDYEGGDDDEDMEGDEDADEDEDPDEDEDMDDDEGGDFNVAGADSDLDDDDEDDFADNIGYAEDAAISADRLEEMMEREEEMESAKGKNKRKTKMNKAKRKMKKARR
ncbi:hypothetical protein QR680_005908 [Steinernema hermaphroditum]|uniref:CCAAT-binding factor domain-containing protein n=1 Tax=Steinernema hermaphroditum TaxID=289476 RepID=A0AA39LW88_9BILA|nr:hypothetical protein QR680_005908 [Steinernema hermaphroditum]